MEKEGCLSGHIKFFGDDNFSTISSRELSPIEKQNAFRNLLKLLGGTANSKDDFLFISRLLHRSFFWGTIDGYIEGVREYEEINKIVEGLISVSSCEEFETVAQEVIEENIWRRKLEIHGRQNIMTQ